MSNSMNKEQQDAAITLLFEQRQEINDEISSLNAQKCDNEYFMNMYMKKHLEYVNKIDELKIRKDRINLILQEYDPVMIEKLQLGEPE